MTGLAVQLVVAVAAVDVVVAQAAIGHVAAAAKVQHVVALEGFPRMIAVPVGGIVDMVGKIGQCEDCQVSPSFPAGGSLWRGAVSQRWGLLPQRH